MELFGYIASVGAEPGEDWRCSTCVIEALEKQRDDAFALNALYSKTRQEHRNFAKNAQDQRDDWMKEAQRFAENELFYRDLITKIGDKFGIDALISDDGSIQDKVLCLKVPELVDSLRAERDAAIKKEKSLYEILYALGCRESCMGWVNERSEISKEERDKARKDLSEWEAADPIRTEREFQLREQITALKKDKEVVDWLVTQHVEVRTPLRNGSRANFHASPDLEEEASDLREQVRAALASRPKTNAVS